MSSCEENDIEDADVPLPSETDNNDEQVEDQEDGPYLNDNSINCGPDASCSYHVKPCGDRAKQIKDENPYVKIEDPHLYLKLEDLPPPPVPSSTCTMQYIASKLTSNTPHPELQAMATSNKEEKQRNIIAVSVIAGLFILLLGLALGGIIIAAQEKSRLDDANKQSKDLASELREKNQQFNQTILKKLFAVKAELNGMTQKQEKQDQINQDVQRQIQDTKKGQNQTHSQLVKGATSCAELRDKYGASESGIYQMMQNGSDHPVYNYCDFQLQAGKYTCDYLLKELKSDFRAAYFWIRETTGGKPKFKFCIKGSSNCKEAVQKAGPTSGRIFKIYPVSGSLASKEVYCDRDGWTVFQRRKDGSVGFYRDWNDYVNGFGDLNGEFWLGLETIHQVTKDGEYELRVDLEDFDGNKSYAQYGQFSIASVSDNYRLSVSSYTGNCGDSLAYHDRVQFSTKDKDNDESRSRDCAIAMKGGWWYKWCHHANLNGKYNSAVGYGTDGVVWHSWKNAHQYLKFTEMKLRKKN